MSVLSRRPATDPAGLVVVVTGGARGIGRATAQRLAGAGAWVAIGDRDADLAHSTAAELDAGARGRVVAAPLDVTDSGSWAAFLDEVAHLGPVDVLVNNAGVMPLGPALEEPEEVTRAILDVNFGGIVHGTRAVAPGMVARGRGHLVNIASAVGRVPAPGGATYTASKHAVVGYSEALRGELRPHGVDVSMVLPLVVATELASGLGAATGIGHLAPEDVAREIERTIRRPRPERWVPRWTQGLARFTSVLPRALQDGMARTMGSDQILATYDAGARTAYESRVRAATPADSAGA